MDIEEIKQVIQREIIDTQFPEFAMIDPQIKSGPSESQLRALRRRRGAVLNPEDIRTLPIEHKFIYLLTENDQFPFDKTIVVVTNDEGETDFIIESK